MPSIKFAIEKPLGGYPSLGHTIPSDLNKFVNNLENRISANPYPDHVHVIYGHKLRPEKSLMAYAEEFPTLRKRYAILYTVENEVIRFYDVVVTTDLSAKL